MMTKFTLSIELDDPLHVQIISVLADIVANEGEIIVDAESILFFMQDVVEGLRNKRTGWPFIIGKIADNKWDDVADNFDEAAKLIRGYSKET